MSQTYDRVLPHVLASKRDVERRLANHNRECHLAEVMVLLDVACDFLNITLDRIDERYNALKSVS